MTEGLRVVAVIQARMSSTRLPGKVMRELGGRVVLDWVVDAARRADGVDDVVVATSVDPSDDAIVRWGAERDVLVTRGPLDDVLTRYLLTARETSADAVVRLTSDCPLLDPALIAEVVAKWRSDPEVDYVSTTLERTLPRGLDVELAKTEALESLSSVAEGHDRVHVTSGLYRSGSGYRTSGIGVDSDHSRFRVTLDEPADAAALEALVAVLPPSPTWRDVVRALEAHPEIVEMNASVRQKELQEG